MEEGVNDAVAIYKPEATLTEQRKAKNEMLKKRVRLLAGNKPKAIKSDDSDSVSVVSEKSDGGMFITGTKVEPRPDSPT